VWRRCFAVSRVSAGAFAARTYYFHVDGRMNGTFVLCGGTLVQAATP
jgi:hypothetical protein